MGSVDKNHKIPQRKGNYPSAPIQQSAYCGQWEVFIDCSVKIGRSMFIICDPVALCLIFMSCSNILIKKKKKKLLQNFAFPFGRFTYSLFLSPKKAET